MIFIWGFGEIRSPQELHFETRWLLGIGAQARKRYAKNSGKENKDKTSDSHLHYLLHFIRLIGVRKIFFGRIGKPDERRMVIVIVIGEHTRIIESGFRFHSAAFR